MNFKFFIIVLFAIIPFSLVAQAEIENELSSNREKLIQIKGEIERIKSQLNKSRNEESSVSKQIALIDKEIALISRAKGLLVRERRLLEKKIRYNNESLRVTQKRIDRLRELYAERLVYSYKFGRLRNIELILNSGSLNQALIRYQYLKLIADQDARMIRTIQTKKRKIEELRYSLNRDLAEKRSNLNAKLREEQTYETRMAQKRTLLKKVQWNQNLYKQRLAQKEAEKQKLNGIIATLERRRIEKKQKGEPQIYTQFAFENFKKAQGKLIWPVRGKVLTRYGKQRDPKSKTYTKNTDIEISSKLGTPVKCVFNGAVSMITYLPGYGNTVIIDHGNGYYTVYSHLDEIYVDKDEFIKLGQVIGTVGDSGSLSGAKLAFGIYGGHSTYNPEKWLR